jgi:2-aminoethylphosphonate-pyruvate transaminase
MIPHPMPHPPTLPAARDKLLFTPGPLTTSLSTKQAMLHDAGSWHSEFNAIVARIRNRLLEVAGVDRTSGWEAIPLQGSGTYGVEAVFQTCVPRNGKVAVLSNGAYGDRMVLMLQHAGIQHTVIRTPENAAVTVADLDPVLARDEEITHVAVVHCETTTGLLNPLEPIGECVRRHGRILVVDAMSSFGGIPMDLEAAGIDYLVSSANKCLEGVPGFAFVICRRQRLLACEGSARSLSLDLLGQLQGFEKNGQFRYTPPTHALLAFDRALEELDLEGGVAARAARYRANHQVLLSGFGQLGLHPFLPADLQSYIITAFHHPKDGPFDFSSFYHQLSERGFIIYPGKLTQADTFRVGTIGRIFPSDMEQLVGAVGAVLAGGK